MLKHIVMIKLKEFKENHTKIEKLNKLKQDLDGLKQKINAVVSIETGINLSISANAFDIVLISEFESEEKLEMYKKHPAHMQVLQFINEIKESIHVVDYKI